MPDCQSIDPLVTPYVDGELDSANRERLEHHLRACPPCYSRVQAERAVRNLLQQRQPLFRGECAPAVLRARCAAYRPVASLSGATATAWRRRAAPFAAAAALVLVVGGAFLYQATARSSRVLAAELAADHVKCFTMNAVLGTHQAAATVESSMASGFGWSVHLPDDVNREGLELVGSRPCLYGEGKVAHIMYRHHGKPVSLFMLPGTDRGEEIVEAFGHQCAIWSGGDRTYVLVARETRSEVQQLAALVHSTFH